MKNIAIKSTEEVRYKYNVYEIQIRHKYNFKRAVMKYFAQLSAQHSFDILQI